MIKHDISHLDHGLSNEQVAYIFRRFAGRAEFFKETIRLPDELGTVPSALYGPAAGDPPVASVEVVHRPRAGRATPSRIVPGRPVRPSQLVTVIAGPSGGHACVLYTAHGGPLAPKEPDDPTLTDAERPESIAFWAEHALAELV